MYADKRIPLTGAGNTRDLGGLKTMDGKTIHPCRLIRSGRLADLTEEDKQTLLTEYNLKTVVDFRAEFEQLEAPDPPLEGVSFVSQPILDARLMGVLHQENIEALRSNQAFLEGMHAGQINAFSFFKEFYQGLVTSPHSISRYRAFFEILLEQETGAVLFHCTAGKDRTGIATILLLFALGVSQEDILEDYLITNHFLKPRPAHAAQSDKNTNPSKRKARGVQEPYFMTALKTIRDNFGSIQHYFEDILDLTPQRIDRLKEMYLC